jgi:hypothetical protein
VSCECGVILPTKQWNLRATPPPADPGLDIKPATLEAINANLDLQGALYDADLLPEEIRRVRERDLLEYFVAGYMLHAARTLPQKPAETPQGETRFEELLEKWKDDPDFLREVEQLAKEWPTVRPAADRDNYEPPDPDMNADGPAERAHRDDQARRMK